MNAQSNSLFIRLTLKIIIFSHDINDYGKMKFKSGSLLMHEKLSEIRYGKDISDKILVGNVFGLNVCFFVTLVTTFA